MVEEEALTAHKPQNEIATSGVCRNLNDFDIEDEPGMIHVIPVSGGADSSALAVFLHKAFPHIKFRMMMTDTGAEPASTMEFLKTVEDATGNTIEIVRGDFTLFELVEKFNGFLPSSQARWCTRELKLKPFQQWMKQFNGQPLTMYVGIRADEAKRVAFDIPGVETVLPFVEMGWKRDQVFGYLSQTVGVPKTYMTRTRSGCTTCPFTRRQEAVGLYQSQAIEFYRGMKYEKLTDEDRGRHQPGVPLWKDSKISANWLSLPMPSDGDILEGSKSKGEDLFGQRGLFCAGEFFFDGLPGCKPFIWHQRFISYSPTLSGIRRQINDRFDHLLQTSEVYELTADDVRQQARFAIWYVEFPVDVLDTDGPRGKSYTWQQGSSYAQIQHITDLLTRALQAEQLRQCANRPDPHLLSVEFEWIQASIAGMQSAELSGRSLGTVVDSMWHVPIENQAPDEEETLTLAPCPMCTI